MRLLVTGFGPFPSMPRNPSAALARAVAASPRLRVHGVAATCIVLTTTYQALQDELEPALATEPDAVLMIGVAGRTRHVRVEQRATSRRSTLYPDAAGTIPTAGRPLPGQDRRTEVHALGALLALRRRAVSARLSRNAGRYLCNAAYFRVLAGGMPAIFIHVPKRLTRRSLRQTILVERLSRDRRLVEAVVDIALAMQPTIRRVAARRGPG